MTDFLAANHLDSLGSLIVDEALRQDEEIHCRTSEQVKE